MSRGPFCTACGHEYRTKDRKPEPFADFCPYCGARGGARLDRKPFKEMSKSAIEKWGLPGDQFGCPARWFGKYVLHLPEPKNQYAEFGIEGHAMGERYMLTGELPQVNSLALKSTQTRAALSLLGGIPHMPPPNLPGLRIESEFHYEFEGVRYMGYKDVWAPLSPATPDVPDRMRFASSLVGDWKFVGRKSFDKYAPIPEKLATDLQATIEAFDDVRRGASDVWLNWVYMPRGERLGKPVRALIHPDTIVPRMRQINSVAKQMLDVLALADAKRVKFSDMPTNANACQAYGQPCPRLDMCHVSKDAQLHASIFSFAQTFDQVNQNRGDQIMQGFPGTPGLSVQAGAPSPLGALVASLPNGSPQMPAPVAAPSPAPVAQTEPHPESMWAIEWKGQRYDVTYKKAKEIVASEPTTKVLGPVQPTAPAVAPTPAPAAPQPVAQAPAPTFAPFGTTPAPVAPPAPAPGKRGRKPKAVPPLGAVAPPAPFSGAPGAITDPDNSEDDAEDADIVDAVNHVFEALKLSVRIVRV